MTGVRVMAWRRCPVRIACAMLGALHLGGCYSQTILAPEDVPKLNGLHSGDTLRLKSGVEVDVTATTTVVVGVEAGHTVLFSAGDPASGDLVVAHTDSRTTYPIVDARFDDAKDVLTVGDASLPHPGATPSAMRVPAGTTDPRIVTLAVRYYDPSRGVLIVGIATLGAGAVVASFTTLVYALDSVCFNIVGGGCDDTTSSVYRFAYVTAATLAAGGLATALVGVIWQRLSKRSASASLALLPIVSDRILGLLASVTY